MTAMRSRIRQKNKVQYLEEENKMSKKLLIEKDRIIKELRIQIEVL